MKNIDKLNEKYWNLLNEEYWKYTLSNSQSSWCTLSIRTIVRNSSKFSAMPEWQHSFNCWLFRLPLRPACSLYNEIHGPEPVWVQGNIMGLCIMYMPAGLMQRGGVVVSTQKVQHWIRGVHCVAGAVSTHHHPYPTPSLNEVQPDSTWPVCENQFFFQDLPRLSVS